MKSLLYILPLVGLVMAQDGGGFFSGITGAFNNLFGGQGQGPPRQQQRPPQRRPPQDFQQQNFQQRPQQQQQQQQSQQQQFQPQQQQFQPQPQFQPPPQQQQPQQQFQSQTFQSAPAPEAPRFNPRPADQPSTTRVVGGTSLCGPAAPNHFWTDPRDNIRRGYVATWEPEISCTTFQQHEAKEYCESMGMHPVSLDSPDKQDFFNRLIAQKAQRYFWTGGEVNHANRVVNWNNPKGSPVPFDQSLHWSHTGGAGLPQPDNRAAGDNPPHPEVCLGILNNFYADGIKWHDVACHHKKPTICEPSF